MATCTYDPFWLFLSGMLLAAVILALPMWMVHSRMQSRLRNALDSEENHRARCFATQEMHLSLHNRLHEAKKSISDLTYRLQVAMSALEDAYNKGYRG